MDFGEIGAAVGAPTSAIGSGLALGGGLLSYAGQHEANKTNIEIAQRQMDFQERMSSSAYQRAVMDMRKAGLNPALAYQQGGASSPPGAGTTVQNELAPAVNSAMAGLTLGSQLMNDMTERDKKLSETNLNKTLEMKAAADTNLSITSAGRTAADTQRIKEESDRLIAERARILVEIRRTDSDIALKRAQERLADVEHDLQFLRSQEVGFGLQSKANESEAANTWWGRNVMPFLNSTLQSATSAARARSALGR